MDVPKKKKKTFTRYPPPFSVLSTRKKVPPSPFKNAPFPYPIIYIFIFIFINSTTFHRLLLDLSLLPLHLSSILRFSSPPSICIIMSFKKGHEELTLEVTVLSADSLKNPSSFLFPRRLRPFVTLSTTTSAYQHQPMYRTRVDEVGHRNPTWHDTIRVPVGPSFLRVAGARGGRREEEDNAAVHVTVLSKCLVRGPTRLGFCRIRPSDVLDGLWPPAMQRRLSYALRSCSHGGRGRGVLHVAVRLLGPLLNLPAAQPPQATEAPPENGWGRVTIGIPVAAPSAAFRVLEWGQREGVI